MPVATPPRVTGTIRTLTLNAKATIKPAPKDNDKAPDYRGKTLFDLLYGNGQVNAFPLQQMEPGYDNDDARSFGFYAQKGLFEEYAKFGREHGHDLAPFDTYHQVRGLRLHTEDLARANGGHRPTLEGFRPDMATALPWLWRRLWGERLPSPLVPPTPCVEAPGPSRSRALPRTAMTAFAKATRPSAR